ncbi:hypothetical protein EQW78_09485 [Oerskovia turbata]|uniref:Large extracellular alpha-helical protein n=1 Tax=Oerskovia turbata TaxID=1713 RepID=A0A4Q1KYJ8_9CELL|nr:DUF5719 family protein [Oerskovia turbata]RXR26717.1 hypothetical protein EQW73_04260 [Oerskovia turbata]RXR34414.1 hypothetical protein EQW78_09485 [Oerskovia turbata]
MTTRSSRPHPLLRRVATIGTGLVAVALTGAVAAVGLPGGFGTVAGAVPDVEQVEASTPERTLVCPAPVRLADSAQVGDAQFGAAPVATATVLRAGVVGGGSTTGSPGETPVTLTGLEALDAAPLEQDGAGATVVSFADVSEGQALRVGAGMPVDTRVAAAEASTTIAGDLRGLAAASCTTPDIDHWLVGGSTEVGSSAQLVLQNPGRTPATVRIEVWGPGGPVVLSGGGQYLVPPGEEVVTLVEAAAPEQRRLTVRVESSGGTVAAYLQHSTLAGLVPLGVDYVVPGASPSLSTAVGFTSSGEAVDDALAPQVRLLAPGAEAGTATLTVYGADGRVRVRGGERVELSPGAVTDQSLGGLPAGSYTVVVDATVPVVAGASEARAGDAVEGSPSGAVLVDRAWIASTPVAATASGAETPARSPRALDRGTVTLVPGTSSLVRVGAVPRERPEDDAPTGAFRGTLRAYGPDGSLLGEQDLDVPAGSTATFDAAVLGAGTEPAVLTLDATEDEATGGQGAAEPVWSVLVTAGAPLAGAPEGAPGTLVSVLLPVPPAQSQGSVDVRVTRTAGLPD